MGMMMDTDGIKGMVNDRLGADSSIAKMISEMLSMGGGGGFGGMSGDNLKSGKMGGATKPNEYGLPSLKDVPKATNQFYTPQAAPDRTQLLDTMMKRAKGGVTIR
jgi:hypothetical protein